LKKKDECPDVQQVSRSFFFSWVLCGKANVAMEVFGVLITNLIRENIASRGNEPFEAPAILFDQNPSQKLFDSQLGTAERPGRLYVGYQFQMFSSIIALKVLGSLYEKILKTQP
jgi:hypothetical protein